MTADLFWTFLKWLIMLLIWGTLTFGITREDRSLRRLPPDQLPARDIPTLLHQLHLRVIQIWILLTLLLVITAIHDVRYDLSLAPPEHITVTPPPEEPPVAQATTPAPAFDKRFAKALPSSSLPFSDITEFNEKDSRQQAYLDWLKQHYEAWFVTYYYLQKCGKTGANDLSLIDEALQKELTTAHADATVHSNILLAATGSYNEMYHDIPCDNAHLAATKSTYDANMHQMQGLPRNKSAPASR